MAASLPVIGYNIGILGQVFTAGFVKVPFKNYEAFCSRNYLFI